MCYHYSYCGIPSIHKNIQFCDSICVLKHHGIEKLSLLSLVKKSCEKHKINKTIENNFALRNK